MHIDVPSPTALTPYASSFWHMCEKYLKAAKPLGVLVTLVGNQGTLPLMVKAQRLVERQSLYTSTHRWCYWGINRDDQRSSNSSIAYSNQPIASHPCKCEPGRAHINMFSERDASVSFALSCEFATGFLAGLSQEHRMQTPPGLTPGQAVCEPHSNVETPLAVPPSTPDSKARVSFSSSSGCVPPVREGSYPTNQKERERDKRNALKEQGIDPKTLVKKKKKWVEEHYDDCGDDLASIAAQAELLALTESSTDGGESVSSTDSDGEELFRSLPLFAFWGSSVEEPPNPKVKLVRSTDLEEALHLLSTAGPGLDLCELCGGAGRSGRVAVRRHLKLSLIHI